MSSPSPTLSSTPAWALPVAGALVGLTFGLTIWLWSGNTELPRPEAAARETSRSGIAVLASDTSEPTPKTAPPTGSPRALALRDLTADLCQLGQFKTALERVRESELEPEEHDAVLASLIEYLLPDQWIIDPSKRARLQLVDLDHTQLEQLLESGDDMAPLLTQLRSPRGVQQLQDRWQAYEQAVEAIRDNTLQVRAWRRGLFWATLIKGIKNQADEFDARADAPNPQATADPDDRATTAKLAVLDVPLVPSPHTLGLQVFPLVDKLSNTPPSDLGKVAVSGSVNLLRTSLLTVLGALATMIWTAVSSRLSQVVHAKVAAHLDPLLSEPPAQSADKPSSQSSESE